MPGDLIEIQPCDNCEYDPMNEWELDSVIRKNIKVTFSNRGVEFNESELAKLVTQEAWKIFIKNKK